MANTISVNINAKGTITGINQVSDGFTRLQKQAKQTQDIIQRAYKINFNASSFNAVSTSVNKAMAGLSRLSPAFQQISKGSAEADKSLFNLKATISGLAGAKTLLTGGIIGAGFIGGVKAAIDKAVEFEKALTGLKSVARSTGNSIDGVEKAAKDLASDGLVPLSDVSNSLKNLLASGLSLPKAIQLFKSLKDSAAFNRQGFLELGESIVGATQGIKNGNSILVDNAGITKNLSVLQKEYAASIGTTIGKLTEAQKIEAAYVGILKEAAIFSGDAAKLSDTYSGATAKLGAAFDRMLAKFGSFVTQSGFVKTAILQMTSIFNAFGEGPQTVEDKIKSLTNQIEAFSKAGKGLDVGGGETPYVKSLRKELALLEETTAKELMRAGIKQRAVLNEKAEKDAIAAKEKTFQEQRIKNEKDFDKLVKSLTGKDGTALENLKAKFDAEMKIIDSAAKAGIKSEKQIFDAKFSLLKKFSSEEAKLNADAKTKRIADAKEEAQARKDILAAIGNAASNPFIGFGRDENGKFGTTNVPENIKAQGQGAVDKFTRNQDLGRGVGVLNSVAGGKEGARGLVVGAAGLALDAIAPGLGEAAKPLLNALSQGPEATKQLVKDFAAAIPDLVEGLIKAIPVLIEEIANQIPVIIERLAEKAPDIILALVKAAPRVAIALALAMPKVALKFAGELIKNLPKIVTEAARAIYDAIKKALAKLNPVGKGGALDPSGKSGSSFLTTGPTKNGTVNAALNIATGGGSGLVSKVTEKFKFKLATGGEVKSVRGGTPFVDSVPALLQQGEVVIDRKANDGLKRFIEKDGNNNPDLMNRILKLLEAPIDVATSVQLNQREFANIVLKLNRTGQRLA